MAERKPIGFAVSGTNRFGLTHFIGRPVGEIRQALITILNLSPDAVAVVNGKPVDESCIIEEGDNLEFVQKSGEKG